MRKLLIIAVVVLSLAGVLIYFRWSSSIHQPLGFSHAQHVRNKISCATCHATAALDTLPETKLCATCHGDQQFPQKAEWVRVYRVAPDIIFSHKNHLTDDCVTCHKEITSGQRWVHESRFTMDFCMKCHEQRRADNSCAACHKNR